MLQIYIYIYIYSGFSFPSMEYRLVFGSAPANKLLWYRSGTSGIINRTHAHVCIAAFRFHRYSTGWSSGLRPQISYSTGLTLTLLSIEVLGPTCTAVRSDFSFLYRVRTGTFGIAGIILLSAPTVLISRAMTFYTGGLGPDILEISRVGSGRVGLGRVGSGFRQNIMSRPRSP